MKKILFLLHILITYSISSTAQVPVDTIAIKKNHVYLGNKRLTFKDLENTLKANDQAYTEFKTVKSNRIITSILFGSGLGLIAGQLTIAATNGKANWAVIGAGAGLVTIGIPISINSIKHAKKAINTYNKDLLKQPLKNNNPEIKISMKGNGVGLIYQF